MNEFVNEFVTIVLSIAIPVSVVCHLLIRTYWIAVPVAVSSTIILFFVQSVLRSEHQRLDPCWGLAVILEGGALAMLIAAIIGAPPALYRRWRKKPKA
jgi:hypothetical protein